MICAFLFGKEGIKDNREKHLPGLYRPLLLLKIFEFDGKERY